MVADLDQQPFMLGGASAQIEGLLVKFRSLVHFVLGIIGNRQPVVCAGEIWIERNGLFEQFLGGFPVAVIVAVAGQRVIPQRLQRGGGGLLDGRLEFIQRRGRLAQLPAHMASYSIQRA